MNLRRPSHEEAYVAIAAGAAILAGVATRQLLRGAWRAGLRRDPPMNPAAHETQWIEAITWTVAVGAAVGVARLLARRATAAGWERYVGRLPVDS